MALVTIYGKPSSTYEYIKSTLQSNLKKAGIDLAFNEIKNTQDFIDKDIKSIPAIKIENEMMEKGTRKANQFIKDLELKILKKENFGNLPIIIVPYDFADASVNALSYALELAKKHEGAVLKILHVFRPKLIEAEESQSIQNLIEQRERMLKKIVDDINNDWYIDVGTLHAYYEIQIGFPADVLLNLAESNSEAMFIMGGSNNKKLQKSTYGSVTTSMAMKGHAPVCIVPQSYKLHQLKTIAFCLDDFNIDKEGIQALETLFDLKETTINFIHFNQGKAEELAEELTYFLDKNLPNTRYNYSSLIGENKFETIRKYLLENNIDHLVLTRRNRSMLKELFHKSLTKKLAIETPVPLTIIHK